MKWKLGTTHALGYVLELDGIIFCFEWTQSKSGCDDDVLYDCFSPCQDIIPCTLGSNSWTSPKWSHNVFQLLFLHRG
jgi:hypothetical protein